MGMRQKKCPSCVKDRPFDDDRDRWGGGVRNGKPKPARWTKILGRWICNYCVVKKNLVKE